MSVKATCTCDWCQKFSPICQKISLLLDNEEERKIFHEMVNNMMVAETDAVYWKEKYYGTWPSDDAADVQEHIKLLVNRAKELEMLTITEAKKFFKD